MERSCSAQGAPRTQWFLRSHTKPTLLHPTGVSAALVFQQEVQAPSTQLRVAFDGDAVLFSDETDQVFREQGLEGAVQYERAMEAVPMGEVSEVAAGPMPTISIAPARVLLWVANKAQFFMGSLCIQHCSVPAGAYLESLWRWIWHAVFCKQAPAPQIWGYGYPRVFLGPFAGWDAMLC